MGSQRLSSNEDRVEKITFVVDFLLVLLHTSMPAVVNGIGNITNPSSVERNKFSSVCSNHKCLDECFL
jgi:hypothetical protein